MAPRKLSVRFADGNLVMQTAFQEGGESFVLTAIEQAGPMISRCRGLDDEEGPCDGVQAVLEQWRGTIDDEL